LPHPTQKLRAFAGAHVKGNGCDQHGLADSYGMPW
jgi:hypothetical protein